MNLRIFIKIILHCYEINDITLALPTTGQGLLLRWHSMNFSPERQHNSEPKAEDKYKS